MNTVNRRQCAGMLAAVIGACVVAAPAFADTFPSKTIALIVPNGPGGPSDVIGRLTAEALARELNGTVVVENRPGAGGIVGTDIVIQSQPDGHTLLFSSNSAFSVMPALRKDLSFDVAKDLTVVGTVARGPQALYVRSSLGVNSVEELVALAKEKPGTLKIASTGAGSVVHMAGEMFKYYAGIDIDPIPYPGGGQAVAAMLGGEIDMMINDLSAVIQYVQEGSLKALAVSNSERIADLPETPTFVEVGLPDVVTSSWFAIGAPSKTPPEVIDTLNQALTKVLATEEFKERLATVGMVPFDLSPQEANTFIAGELAKWQKVVSEANIKIE